MEASVLCHGAATIVNAIATGRGAAFGISLETRAHVRLNEKSTFTACIEGCGDEDTTLIRLCAKKVLRYFKLDYGADIVTESNIPIAAGLKSSSTAANAVCLATLAAIRKEHKAALSDGKLIDLAVDAALEAKVTVTGAYDDACASYFGGYVVTDNAKRRILKKGRMPEDLKVLIYVPDKKSYTSKVDVKKTKILAAEVSLAWKQALKGNLYSAMNVNGLLYSAALGYDAGIPLAALEAGAIAAGLSGKGPSVVALTKKEPEKIKEAWSAFEGRIIEANINNRKAEVLA
jgi:shikimate kinase